MSPTTLLLIVDPQIDFCHPTGALFVPGADKDIQRIVGMLEAKSSEIDQIVVTLDSHQVVDIAHPGYWSDEQGNHPAPFTTISATDVINGRWIPAGEKEHAVRYLQTLEEQGEFTHVIWPEHCLIGTPGHAIAPELGKALTDRARKTGKNHITVIKGLNPDSEHFGIFEAQVPVETDPETQLNTRLLEKIGQYERILVCGEAKSHCVATSIKQLARYAPGLLPRVVLLSDCMSDVAGLGHLAHPIYEEAVSLGAQFLSSNDL